MALLGVGARQGAAEGLERYLVCCGTGGDGTAIFADLVELLEEGAARGTPIRLLVGDDPVEFIEAFIRNYTKGAWIMRERERLTNTITRACGEA